MLPLFTRLLMVLVLIVTVLCILITLSLSLSVMFAILIIDRLFCWHVQQRSLRGLPITM